MPCFSVAFGGTTADAGGFGGGGGETGLITGAGGTGKESGCGYDELWFVHQRHYKFYDRGICCVHADPQHATLEKRGGASAGR